MAFNVDNWFDQLDASGKDLAGSVGEQRQEGISIVDFIVSDVVAFGRDEGYTKNQTRGAIEDLFRTFVDEWFLYTYIRAEDIITAIQNDVTLAWFDLEAPPGSGVTMRTRLVNRLS